MSCARQIRRGSRRVYRAASFEEALPCFEAAQAVWKHGSSFLHWRGLMDTLEKLQLPRSKNSIFGSSSTPRTLPVSVSKAYGFFRDLRDRGFSKDILLDCKIASNPRGANKQWEIELSFFHCMFRFGRYVVGVPFRGYFACHKTGSFVTYSVAIEGQELWFDEYELAVASLTKGESPPPRMTRNYGEPGSPVSTEAEGNSCNNF